MRRRTLSWGLHQGRQFQEQVDERGYADVVEERYHNQKNCGEISPEELHLCGTCKPIKVDVSTTHHLGNGGCVRGSGENDSGNLFALSFLQKDENPLTYCRNYKYDSNQGGCTGPPEPSDVSKVKYISFHW